MVWALLAASEATTASKQPQRLNLTSDLKSATPITYLSTGLSEKIGAMLRESLSTARAARTQLRREIYAVRVEL